jgi:alkylation response protein AidB-like acyl-CoA dehydrogenase
MFFMFIEAIEAAVDPLRVGVPPTHGGVGGGPRDVVQAIAAAARSSAADAVKLASQRLLVEVLLRSENVGLREYRLASLLDNDIPGNCACLGSLAEPAPAVARDTGRGWRIEGALPPVCNLGRAWFVVSAPVLFEGAGDYSLVLIRSDEDGLERRDEPLVGLPGIDRASLTLNGVFFREDEVLASDGRSLVRALAPLSTALRCAVLAGACMGVVDKWQDERAMQSHLSTLGTMLQRVAGLLDTGPQGHELSIVLYTLRRHVTGYASRPLTASTAVSFEDRTMLAQLRNL